MVRSKPTNVYKSGVTERVAYGLSTDDKPTAGYATGSVFIEVNTGKAYLYDEESETWNEVGS